MDGKGFQFREHPVCAVLAGVAAVLYWISVWGAYSAAESNVTGLGYEYIPFMILSLPWSGLSQYVLSLIPNHETAHVAFGISCLSLCGVNAAVLFFVVYRMLSRLFDRWLGD